MTVLQPNRASSFVLLLAIAALSSCSDDDSPPPDPTLPDASVSSISSSEVSTSSSATSSETTPPGDGGSPTSAPPGVDTSSDDAGVSPTSEPPDSGTDEGKTLLEGLASDPDLTTLVELIDKAQIEDDLLKEGPFTVLAPSNDAWSRLPAGYLDALSRKQLETLVRNHLSSVPRTAAELVQLQSVNSVIEFEHQFTATDTEIYVNGLTRITARDRTYDGNKVHKVDSVLTVGVFPGTLADAVHAYPRLSELDGRLSEDERALLSEDDKTLFAPINGGFEAMAGEATEDAGTDAGVPQSSLSYHVLPHRVDSIDLGRGGVTSTAEGAYLGLSTDVALAINDGRRVSKVLVADLRVDSGAEGSVLHLVEEALLPPPSVFELLQQGVGGETFESLIAVSSSTEVPGAGESFADHLAGADNVSLFAPPDTAFGRIAGPFGELASVVGFHVIDEIVDSPRLLEAENDELPSTLTSSAVKNFVVVNASGTVLLDGFVTLLTRDIPAANGVIHLVDGVLVPRGVTFPGTTPQALAAYPALSKTNDAVAATNLLTGVTSTLFAPFNAAFGPVGSFNDFVRQHAATAVVRDSATLGIQFSLLNGETILADTQTMTVKGAHIVRPDLVTASGVVHIVDGTLTDRPADAGAGDAGN